ncbi:DUF3718 domain-containing protein [Lacimicrobium sp. SS2-24]|uniref:DUF3718 domain-containing protein n=1 Tax=Lacimicrobium sp. SS2-24 TaxID=2005569 RepID=UPI001438E89E|nr:DUF3718 domain-containing protein [Lacimicrobium sp. SS2-24]
MNANKMIKAVMIAGVSGLLFTTPAKAIDQNLENKLVSLCKATMQDRAIRLDSKIREYHMRYQDVAQGLVCNGESVMKFALTHNAHSVYGLFEGRVPKGSVEIRDVARNEPGKVFITVAE